MKKGIFFGWSGLLDRTGFFFISSQNGRLLYQAQSFKAASIACNGLFDRTGLFFFMCGFRHVWWTQSSQASIAFNGLFYRTGLFFIYFLIHSLDRLFVRITYILVLSDIWNFCFFHFKLESVIILGNLALFFSHDFLQHRIILIFELLWLIEFIISFKVIRHHCLSYIFKRLFTCIYRHFLDLFWRFHYNFLTNFKQIKFVLLQSKTHCADCQVFS